ncbi:ankyrin repeat domain-containing protein [Flavobacterium selenitireducens]|uniref:ankyrin repeat domain-containing protein n=1 Tax=Flavobacterium selenitireducens TaxID=2722704 RepID=UPI001CC2A655|nr:ankyrin repeat domain-containing protein [Flavobacterium selenitireducens]
MERVSLRRWIRKSCHRYEFAVDNSLPHLSGAIAGAVIGYNPKQIAMDQITQALFAASRQGNVPVLNEIFELTRELDVRDEKGYTPLILAVYNNQIEAAGALLDAGADIDAADAHGNTALMGACFKGHTEVAGLLVKRGVALDSRNGNGGTALMFAAMFQRVDIIKLLLDSGANKELLDSRGLSALDHANLQGNSAAAEKLR